MVHIIIDRTMTVKKNTGKISQKPFKQEILLFIRMKFKVASGLQIPEKQV